MGGSLIENDIHKLLTGVYKDIKNFVETGTYKAQTSILASKILENVYTTEIHIERYHESIKNAADQNIKNIKFYFGDSVELLKKITPQVVDGAIFFLDAHQSGNDTGHNGKQNCPLLLELDSILCTKNIKPSVYIIDDLRLFGIKEYERGNVTKKNILERFETHGYRVVKSFEENDRFFIFT